MQFKMKYIDGKLLFNEYECIDCSKHSIEHYIIEINHGYTDKKSCWGVGLPTTIRKCSNCQRQDGPWVDARLVEGY